MKTFDRNGALKVNAAPISFGDSSNIDAFGRLRISSPVGLFDAQLEYDTDPINWETTLTGLGSPTATHSAADSTVTLALTTTDTSQSVLRQTRKYHRYQPGRGHFVFLTFNFVDAVAPGNVVKEVGLGDREDGVFIQQTSAGARLVRRKGASDTTVAQASWNLDVMDGTGASGVTLDWTKAQLFAIDLEWLGVGRVRCGFVVDGVLHYVHQFLASNVLTTTYIRTANLPIRYKISKSSGTTATSLLQICSSVFSEGGFELPSGRAFAFGNGITGISVTTRRAVLSIRPKATFNSIVNRGQISLHEMSLAGQSAAAQITYWEMVYDPTYTTGEGALTWTSVDANSIVEYSIHGDANAGAFSGGTVVQSGYLTTANNNQATIDQPLLEQQLPLVLDSSGANPKALAVVVTCTGATTCYAALHWEEVR